MRWGMGMGMGEGQGSPVLYTAEAKAYFAALATQPDGTIKAGIDLFITRLKAAGVWSKLDAIYLLANHEADGNIGATSTALVNLIDPTKYLGTISGTIAHKQYWGCKTGTSTSYIDTGINLSSNPAPKIAKASATIIFDISGDVVESSKSEISGFTSNGILIRSQGSSNKLLVKMNTGGSSQPTPSPAPFLFGQMAIAKRQANEYHYKLEGGSEVQITGLTDSNVENVNLKIFGSGSTDTSNKRLAVLAIGSQLSTAELTEWDNAYSLLRAIIRYARFQVSPQDSVVRLQWQYNNTDYPNELIGSYTVTENALIGSTGLGYKRDAKQLIVARYNQNTSAKLWMYDRSDLIPFDSEAAPLTPVPSAAIDVSGIIDYLQGVDYDDATGYYWLYGTRKGMASTNANRCIIVCDSSANIITQNNITWAGVEPGMLVVFGNTVWITGNAGIDTGSGYEQKLLILDKNTFAILDSIAIPSTSQEPLAIDKINRKFWTGQGATFSKHEITGRVMKGDYENQAPGDEMEGAVIDPTDDTLWLAADCSLHGSVNNGNMVQHYDFDNTYGKFVRFPEAIRWDEGTIGTGLSVSGNRLVGVGIWTSPVMDFAAYTDFIANAPVATKDNKTITYRYRGSNSAPSTTPNTELPLQYFPGWGTTNPGSWQATPPSNRYVQIEITIA